MRVLIAYYGAIHDKQQLDRMAGLVVKQRDKEIKHVRTLLDEAVEDGQVERAKALLKRLDKYDPEENYELKALRAKVAKLTSKKLKV
jgi:hypothetical protein